MNVQVKLFARARELAGTAAVALELSEPARVRDVRQALANRYPQLHALAPHLLVSVGTDYADDDTPLTADAQLALFPPVSGG